MINNFLEKKNADWAKNKSRQISEKKGKTMFLRKKSYDVSEFVNIGLEI